MPGKVFWLFERILLAALVLLAVRLFRSGLYRRYKMFFAYILWRAVMVCCVLLLKINSTAYFFFWVFTTPLAWIFYICVILELFRLSLERHQGLYSLGKWAMYIGMAVSVVISMVSVLPKIKPTPQSRIMGYIMGTDRGVTLSLAIFVILMLFLLSRYPVPVGRNVALHVTLFTTYFLSSTLSAIAQSVFGKHLYAPVDLAMAGVSIVCVLGWFGFLTPQGEDVQVNVPHFAPDNEQRILQHLDLLNSTLLRVAHK